MSGSSERSVRRRGAIGSAVLAVAVVLIATAAAPRPVGAATDAGSASQRSAAKGSARASSAGDDRGPYRPPVAAPVIDAFREPAGPYGPGNRGLEYATIPGTPIGAMGAGRVAFAGQVAGRLAVTVLHPDGLRSSVTGLAEVLVRVGDLVALGAPLGLSGRRTHLGVRAGTRYIDPGGLFDLRRRAVLVPMSSPLDRGTTVTGRSESGRPPPTRTNVRPGTPSVALFHFVARGVVPGSRRTEGKEPS